MIYDEEMILKDAVDLVKSKLPAEIIAINTEKNDTIVLDSIDDTRYVLEFIDQKVLNYKGAFILYGLVSSPVKEKSSQNLLEDVTLTFNVGLFDSGEKDRSINFYKLLRYRRALKKIFLDNPDVFRGYAKSFVVSLKPDAIPVSNNVVILTMGIDVTASVTAI